MPIIDIIDSNYYLNNFPVSSVNLNKEIEIKTDSTSGYTSDSSTDSNKYNFLDNNFYFIKLKNNNLKSKKNIRKLFKI